MDALDYIFISIFVALWCIYDSAKDRQINEKLDEIKAECKARCDKEMVGDQDV